MASTSECTCLEEEATTKLCVHFLLYCPSFGLQRWPITVSTTKCFAGNIFFRKNVEQMAESDPLGTV